MQQLHSLFFKLDVDKLEISCREKHSRDVKPKDSLGLFSSTITGLRRKKERKESDFIYNVHIFFMKIFQACHCCRERGIPAKYLKLKAVQIKMKA